VWGTPRIVGELAKLGIEVAKSTVDKYRVRPRKPPSPTWKAFLQNHVTDLVSIDFFVVPTIQFKLLFVLVVLAHARRKVIHCTVTENPTAQWTAQQIIEAFPWDRAPKYLLRDRDAIYGNAFQQRVQTMGIEQVLSAPRSPWQSPFVERLIGCPSRNLVVLDIVDFVWSCGATLDRRS
jgi:putative transposase